MRVPQPGSIDVRQWSLRKCLGPSPYSRPAGLALARHCQHRHAGRNNPNPLYLFLRPVAITDDRSQSYASSSARRNGRSAPYPENRMARPAVNPMLVSMCTGSSACCLGPDKAPQQRCGCSVSRRSCRAAALLRNRHPAFLLLHIGSVGASTYGLFRMFRCSGSR